MNGKLGGGLKLGWRSRTSLRDPWHAAPHPPVTDDGEKPLRVCLQGLCGCAGLPWRSDTKKPLRGVPSEA